MTELYMHEALAMAHLAMEQGDVPVGCVIVNEAGKIIGRGYNRREKNQNALAHAEIEAINEACINSGSWRLNDCAMYVTLEPCPMCAGAVINARVKKLFYGAKSPETGSCGSVINLFMERYGHEPQIVGGVLEEDCSRLLKYFFNELHRK